MAAVWDDEQIDPVYDIETSHTGRLNRDGEYTVYMQAMDEDICGFCSMINAMHQLPKYFEYIVSLPNGSTVKPEDIDAWLRETGVASPFRAGPGHYGMNLTGLLEYARNFMFVEQIVEERKKLKKRLRTELENGRKIIAGVNWTNSQGGHFITIVDVEKSTLPWGNNTWTVLDSLTGTETITMPTKDGLILYENKAGLKGYLDTVDLVAVY